MPKPRILLKEGRPDLFAELDVEKNIEMGIDVEYLTTGSGSVYWVCKYDHKWRNAVYNRNVGADCRICRKVKYGVNDLFSQRKDLVAEWDYEKNSELNIMDYSYGSDKVVWWQCSKCSYSWEKKIMHRSQGSGCPECKYGQMNIKQYGSKRSKPLLDDPILLSEWDYEKNGDINPKSMPRNSHKYAWWICRFDNRHKWEVQIIARAKDGRNCPVCNNRKIIVGVNDIPTTHPKLLDSWDYDKNIISPANFSFGSRTSVWWKCVEGHSWKAPIKTRFRGSGCPDCNSVTSNIQKEFYQEILKVILDLKIDKRLPVRFKSLKSLSVDMISREYNVVIEYDGIYYHSGARSEKGLQYHLDHDTEKTKALLEAGYKVVRIRENALQYLELENDNLVQFSYFLKQSKEDVVNKIMEWLES